MVKNPLAGSGRCSRRGRGPWVGKTPWGRARPPALVFLPGESNGQRSLAATAQKAVKSPTRLKQLRVLGSTGLSGDGAASSQAAGRRLRSSSWSLLPASSSSLVTRVSPRGVCPPCLSQPSPLTLATIEKQSGSHVGALALEPGSEEREV